MEKSKKNAFGEPKRFWRGTVGTGVTIKTLDTPLCAGDKFKIPNTIFAFWAGDAGNIGKWYVEWSGDIAYLKARGFLVVAHDAHDKHGKSKDDKKDDSKDEKGKDKKEGKTENTTNSSGFIGSVGNMSDAKSLHGLLVWSHGNGDSFNGIPYKDIETALDYKLGFVLINACFSSKGAKSIASDKAKIGSHTGWCDPTGGWGHWSGPTHHGFSRIPSARRISSRKAGSRAAAKRFLAMLILAG